jgi:hypothetical protein
MMGESEPRSAVAAGGIYHLRDGRVNPDTVSAIIQYPGGWSLTFESTVLPILNERPSVVFQGTEGTLDIARDGYVFRPHKGEAATVRAAGSLETAHAGGRAQTSRSASRLAAPFTWRGLHTGKKRDTDEHGGVPSSMERSR